MNALKSVLLLGSLFCAIVTMPSCSKESHAPNPCADIVCQNGGSCVEGNCECLDGFSGDNCEIEDLCITQAIVCQYDGQCEAGNCVCTEFTLSYLVGTWMGVGYSNIVTFSADGMFIDGGGTLEYNIDLKAKTINFTKGGMNFSTWTILETDFSCNTFSYTTSSTQIFTATRQ